MAEAVDPLESKLSGGMGDNPKLSGGTPVDDHQQINDKLKDQNANTADYLKKIKPHVQMTYKQNSSNIIANHGDKTARTIK